MAQTKVKELKYIGTPILVEVAKRDFAGNIIHETYLKRTELDALQQSITNLQETAHVLENVSTVVSKIKDYSGKPLETDAEGAVIIDQSVVGLSQVNNTSDLDKPISRAVQAALDAKMSNIDLGDENDIVLSAEDKAVSARGINVYVTSVIDKLTAGAAASLDTLGEISNALNNDANVINGLLSNVALKQSKVLESAVVINGITRETVQQSIIALNNYINEVKNTSAPLTINVDVGEVGNTTKYTSAEAALNALNLFVRTKQDKLEFGEVEENSQKVVRSGDIYSYTQDIIADLEQEMQLIQGAVDMNHIMEELLKDSGLAIATTTSKGLMSGEDKAHLDAIYATFVADNDTIVDKIQEVLKVFEEYPAASNILDMFAGKQDKQLTSALTIGQDTATTVETALAKIVTYIDGLQGRLDAETVKRLIGNAIGTDGNNPAVSGLMSGEDKDRLDALYSILGVPSAPGGQVSDGPDQDNIVNKLSEIIEKFSDYYETDGTIKQLLANKVDLAQFSATTDDLRREINTVKSKQEETLYVYDKNSLVVNVTAEANHIYSYLPSIGLQQFILTIPDLSQFNDYNGLGWACYFNLSIGNNPINLIPRFTNTAVPIAYFSNGFQVTSITMEAGKLEKLFIDYDGQVLSIFQQEFSKAAVV